MALNPSFDPTDMYHGSIWGGSYRDGDGGVGGGGWGRGIGWEDRVRGHGGRGGRRGNRA